MKKCESSLLKYVPHGSQLVLSYGLCFCNTVMLEAAFDWCHAASNNCIIEPFTSSGDCFTDRFLQTWNLNLMHDASGCHVKVFIYHILIIYCTYFVLKVNKSEMWDKVVTTSYPVSLFVYSFCEMCKISNSESVARVWANKSRSFFAAPRTSTAEDWQVLT